VIAGNEDHLLDLASSIDEDRPIDWDAVEDDASGDEAERAIVSELRVLATMARVVRVPDATVTTGPLTSSPGEAPGESLPTTWGALTIVERIGVGAFGSVYRARDNLNRDLALKLFSEPAHSARVLREGRLLARVRHPNIVVVHSCNEVDGRVGLSMELIRGRTLEEELQSRGALSAQEAGFIGLDLCRALAAVHEAGLVHRDVKAQNVMRENGGRIVLMDFGAGADSQGIEPGVTGIVGTPSYLAPEVFAGQRASRASDIYSLGVLLYHLVTGRFPVDGSNRSEIQLAHEGRNYRHLRDTRPDLPEGFVQVVETTLAADPRDRYQTAGELEQALLRSCGTPAESRRVISRPSTRRLAWRVTIGAVSVVAIALLTFVGARLLLPPTAPEEQLDSGATDKVSAPAVSAVPAARTDTSYTIAAAFYKFDGRERHLLGSGGRVSPGDALTLQIEVSAPVFVYVINEDDHGEAFLLFPLEDQDSTSPLAAGVVHELPGLGARRGLRWQVTSAGGREHFVVFASPVRMTMLDRLAGSLPRPVSGAPIAKPRIPTSTMGQLRGVGGLVPTGSGARQSDAHYLFETVTPLGSRAETTRGLWVRQLTLDNPGR
jgi:eukaryotic-like serine/threonine-protein kinase